MFQVDNIWDESKKIIGVCDDQKLLTWAADVVTMIANKGDFEGWKGFIDICTTDGGRCVSLPREVGTVYAVNVGGNPTLGLGQLFNFHLNGPGDCVRSCNWTWQDLGTHATYRDIVTPSKLVAYAQNEADDGKRFIVHGYDVNGNRLRFEECGVMRDGYPVPVIYGYAVPASDAPTVARITGISKDPMVGTARLSTIDNDGATGILLGVYEPDEIIPQLRRIQLGIPCRWVRIAFRKTDPTFTSRFDHVPLKSRMAFLLGMQARKFYSERNLADAHAFEADAARLELEAQNASESPTYSPIQIIDHNNIQDKSEADIR
jgi:hypothetical protein